MAVGAGASVTQFYVRSATPRPQMPIAFLRQVNVHSTSATPVPEQGLDLNESIQSPNSQPPFNQ